MKAYKINTPHLCRPLGFKKLMHKQFRDYIYLESDDKPVNSKNKFIHRYAKDYEAGGLRFTILLLTNRKSDKRVEGFLNEVAKQVEANNALKSVLPSLTIRPLSLTMKYEGAK